MEFKILQKPAGNNHLYIIDNEKALTQIPALSAEEKNYAATAIAAEQTQITINQYGKLIFLQLVKNKKTEYQTLEVCRKAGADWTAVCNKQKLQDIVIHNLSALHAAAYTLAEGMALANYQFLKYRSDARKITNSLKSIAFEKQAITLKELNQLSITAEAIYHARTLVNEPLNYLTA
ncbi:MAG: M17 family peptidase N-terminal domain-containing protein, partial [Flavipsychrobacter sp.]